MLDVLKDVLIAFMLYCDEMALVQLIHCLCSYLWKSFFGAKKLLL